MRPYWDIVDSINYLEKVDITKPDTDNLINNLSNPAILSAQVVNSALLNNAIVEKNSTTILNSTQIDFYSIYSGNQVTINIPSITLHSDVFIVAGSGASLDPITDFTMKVIKSCTLVKVFNVNHSNIHSFYNTTVQETVSVVDDYDRQEIKPSTTYSFTPEINASYYIKIVLNGEIISTVGTLATLYSNGQTITLPETIKYSVLNRTGFKIYPVVGYFGILNGVKKPLDINDNVVVSSSQKTKKLNGYTGTTSGILTTPDFILNGNTTTVDLDIITVKERII